MKFLLGCFGAFLALFISITVLYVGYGIGDEVAADASYIAVIALVTSFLGSVGAYFAETPTWKLRHYATIFGTIGAVAMMSLIFAAIAASPIGDRPSALDVLAIFAHTLVMGAFGGVGYRLAISLRG